MRKLRVFGVAVLLVVLAACEKGVSDGGISIRFSLGDTSYGADEVRGAEMQPEPETVVVPVEGVVHMYATLAEEEESSFRAAGDEVMENGTLLVIAAYNEGGSYVTSAEYEVTNSSGGIKPTAASGIGLTLSAAGKYRFVAYSLNLTTVPAYTTSIGPYSPNEAGDDPLWGDSGNEPVTVTEGVNDIRIAMRHAFSQVTLKASSADLAGTKNITALSAVLVGYKAVIQNGSLGKGAAEEQPFASFGPYGSTAVTSPPKLVYAGGDAVTTIKIVSATIGGTTHTGSVARFNKQLLPGRRYILNVKFDELVWAGSNIHWHQSGEDTNNWYGYLDFDLAGNIDDQGFQGVGFKWGSLVGVPLSMSNSNSSFPLDGTTRARVFVPIINPSDPNKSWYVSKSPSYTVWQAAAAGDTDNASIIPYMDGRYVATDVSRNNTYLIDAERNTDAMHANFRGDICQYIGKVRTGLKGYRLPTSNELGTTVSAGGLNSTNPVSGGWRKFGNFSEASYNDPLDGRTDFIKRGLGYIQNSSMGVTLPASGARRPSDGLLFRVGYHGDYWSGSAAATPNAYFLYTNGSDMVPGNADNRSHGLAVRCVRN